MKKKAKQSNWAGFFFSTEALRRGEALKSADFPSLDNCVGYPACSIQKLLVGAGAEQPGPGAERCSLLKPSF